MKLFMTAIVATLITASSIGTTQAQQSDVLNSTSSGEQKCLDSAKAMAACHSFIEGFLQGALITDAAIIESIGTTKQSYAERAMRTRLDKRSTDPTALAGFCLPANRSILELTDETLAHVKASKRNSAELAKNVYNSLKIDYPCK